jgi:hypothetical protein
MYDNVCFRYTRVLIEVSQIALNELKSASDYKFSHVRWQLGQMMRINMHADSSLAKIAKTFKDICANKARGACYENDCIMKNVELNLIANPLDISQYDILRHV